MSCAKSSFKKFPIFSSHSSEDHSPHLRRAPRTRRQQQVSPDEEGPGRGLRVLAAHRHAEVRGAQPHQPGARLQDPGGDIIQHKYFLSVYPLSIDKILTGMSHRCRGSRSEHGSAARLAPTSAAAASMQRPAPASRNSTLALARL